MRHHAMRMDNHRLRLLNWHGAQEDTINTKTRTKTKMGDQMGDRMGDPNGLSPKGPGPTDGLPDLLRYNKERKRGRSFEGNMPLKANTKIRICIRLEYKFLRRSNNLQRVCLFFLFV